MIDWVADGIVTLVVIGLAVSIGFQACGGRVSQPAVAPTLWCDDNDGHPICIVRNGEQCASYYCRGRYPCALIVTGPDSCVAEWIEP